VSPYPDHFARRFVDPEAAARLATSDDPTEYRQIRGEAGRRIVAIRFVCGGCGLHVATIGLDNDDQTRAIPGHDRPWIRPTRAAERDGLVSEALDGAGEMTKLVIACRSCRTRSGRPREAQVTEATAARWLDLEAGAAGSNARRIVDRKF